MYWLRIVGIKFHSILTFTNIYIKFLFFYFLKRRNPLIGYCQGMNLIAACLLLILEEEESFWVFSAIMELIMPPDYFTLDLLASQADQRFYFIFISFTSFVLFIHFYLFYLIYLTIIIQIHCLQFYRVLKELALERVPKLVKHLEANGVDLTLITFNWFITIFVDCVPPEVISNF